MNQRNPTVGSGHLKFSTQQIKSDRGTATPKTTRSGGEQIPRRTPEGKFCCRAATGKLPKRHAMLEFLSCLRLQNRNATHGFSAILSPLEPDLGRKLEVQLCTWLFDSRDLHPRIRVHVILRPPSPHGALLAAYFHILCLDAPEYTSSLSSLPWSTSPSPSMDPCCRDRS